jgi:hypothetical protein
VSVEIGESAIQLRRITRTSTRADIDLRAL